MNIHRATTAAAAALLGLTLFTGCSSSSAGAAADSNTSTAPTPLALDRKNVAAVATAFADNYASGNTPAACALTAGSATKTMTSKGLCQTRMSWNEIPRQIVDCPATATGKIYAYEVDHEIARFLIFGIRLQPVNGFWSVAAFSMSTPGDGTYGCKPLGANNGNG